MSCLCSQKFFASAAFGGSIGRVQVQAYISNHKTFTIECPKCLQADARRLSDLSSDHPNPFQCTCPCGAQFEVRLVGFRGGVRKAVRLAASFARLGRGRTLGSFATVLDLSVNGMRFVTEYHKVLRVKDEVRVTLVLNDGKRTKLECAATVQRIKLEKDHATVGVEFHPLSDHDRAILKAYLSS